MQIISEGWGAEKMFEELNNKITIHDIQKQGQNHAEKSMHCELFLGTELLYHFVRLSVCK